MNIEAIRGVHRAQPFVAYTLHLFDGRRIRVDRPESLLLPPANRRTVVGATKSGDIRIIDVQKVKEIRLHKSGSH